jgi:hypothetical protein
VVRSWEEAVEMKELASNREPEDGVDAARGAGVACDNG